jgi:hypothetical protein
VVAQAGRSAFAEAFPLNTVGALVEFVCDVEQIVAQQIASHSLGRILDELGSLSRPGSGALSLWAEVS